MSRFEGGSYPSAEIIGNVMHNEANIPESWKTKLANIFIRSLEAAGPIPIEGIAPLAPTIDPLESALLGSTGPLTQPPHGAHTFDLPLANNRKVTVTAPIDLKPDEMKRLKAWLPLTFLMDWKPEDKN